VALCHFVSCQLKTALTYFVESAYTLKIIVLSVNSYEVVLAQELSSKILGKQVGGRLPLALITVLEAQWM